MVPNTFTNKNYFYLSIPGTGKSASLLPLCRGDLLRVEELELERYLRHLKEQDSIRTLEE